MNDSGNPEPSNPNSPPPIQTPAPQSPLAAPAPAPAKKSPLPWILGGCGCLAIIGLLVVVVGGFTTYKLVSEAQKGIEESALSQNEESPLEVTTPEVTVPEVTTPLVVTPLENIVIPGPPDASSQGVPLSTPNVDLSTPVATTKAFFAAMKAGDQAAAQLTLGGQMREMASKGNIQKLFDSLQEDWVEIVSISDEPTFTKDSTDKCGVPVNFINKKGVLEMEKVNLVLVEGKWLITGF